MMQYDMIIKKNNKQYISKHNNCNNSSISEYYGVFRCKSLILSLISLGKGN